MDRVIKFRGFSVLFNRWIYGVGLKYDRKGKPQIYVDTGWYEVYEGSEGQFTGLTDHNDNEIYERDILKFEHLHNYVNELQVVSMDKFMWGTDEFGFQEMVERDYKFEVIGNIYEHPHLLEGVK